MRISLDGGESALKTASLAPNRASYIYYGGASVREMYIPHAGFRASSFLSRVGPESFLSLSLSL